MQEPRAQNRSQNIEILRLKFSINRIQISLSLLPFRVFESIAAKDHHRRSRPFHVTRNTFIHTHTHTHLTTESWRSSSQPKTDRETERERGIGRRRKSGLEDVSTAGGGKGRRRRAGGNFVDGQRFVAAESADVTNGNRWLLAARSSLCPVREWRRWL